MTRDEIRRRAADIIEPYVTSRLKRRQSAESTAAMLDFHDLLRGDFVDAQERVANLMQCQMSWPTAEKVAAELAAAGLLTN